MVLPALSTALKRKLGAPNWKRRGRRAAAGKPGGQVRAGLRAALPCAERSQREAAAAIADRR